MLEFTDKVVGKAFVEVTEKDIENIVVTSVEGGSGYWMGIADNPEWDNKPKDEPHSTWMTKMLLDGKEVHLYDIEDEEEKWVLTLEKVVEGIGLNMKNRTWDTDMQNLDAITADCIIQFGLFGEVVYG